MCVSEPVKLSRERWVALARYMVPQCPADYETSGRDRLILAKPIEIDGVTFLPAEYVPYEPPWTCLTIPMVRA